MVVAQPVEIRGIAAGGAGVGRDAAGKAVFVHRTAPGELVSVVVEEERSRWSRGRLSEILRPSPDRRDAPCPHYDRCGGCTLEHLRYEAQLAAKADLVRETLRRIGGTDLALPEVVPSPREFRYRNRVSFTLLRLPGGRVVAGFHELARPGRILDIGADCLLPEEPIARAWSSLRAAWGPGAERLPGGRRLRLTLRASEAGEVALLVEGGSGAGQAEQLLADVPGLTSIWQRRHAAEQPRRSAGRALLAEAWQEEEVEVGGVVFLQVNRGAAALLEEHVLRVLGDVAGRTIVDAYCGVGLHARRLARAGARVTGIELDAHAVAEAERAAPENARFLAGRVEELLQQALPAELVILNPPRAGIDAAAARTLLATPPLRIVYVSCDPATLARDIGRLGTRFGVASLRCFDLFPQTAHVETVAELVCATS
jgi:23S rRNA (uracil1939-C5)-methyltransferase